MSDHCVRNRADTKQSNAKRINKPFEVLSGIQSAGQAVSHVKLCSQSPKVKKSASRSLACDCDLVFWRSALRKPSKQTLNVAKPPTGRRLHRALIYQTDVVAIEAIRKDDTRQLWPEAHGRAHLLVTDKLRSYGAALKVIGNFGRQTTGRWLNNRCENPHQPFRRREVTIQRFRSMGSLQKFSTIHTSVYNHFNQERHLYSRNNFKINRNTALNEWRQICAA